MTPFEPALPDTDPDNPEFGVELPIPNGLDAETFRLRRYQRGVLECMMKGMSIAKAARPCQVHRTTIHR